MSHTIEFETLEELAAQYTVLKYAHSTKKVPMDTAIELLNKLGLQAFDAAIHEVAFESDITKSIEGRHVLTEKNEILKVLICRPLHRREFYGVVFEGHDKVYTYDESLVTQYSDTPIIMKILPANYPDGIDKDGWAFIPLPDKPKSKKHAK